MADRRQRHQQKLRPVVDPSGVFAPSHLLGVGLQVGPGDVVMHADLCAPDPREKAFRIVRAGALVAVGVFVVDPLHVEACVVERVPRVCLVGVDRAARPDAPFERRDGLRLVLDHERLSAAATLAHNDDHSPFAVPVLRQPAVAPVLRRAARGHANRRLRDLKERAVGETW